MYSVQNWALLYNNLYVSIWAKYIQYRSKLHIKTILAIFETFN